MNLQGWLRGLLCFVLVPPFPNITLSLYLSLTLSLFLSFVSGFATTMIFRRFASSGIGTSDDSVCVCLTLNTSLTFVSIGPYLSLSLLFSSSSQVSPVTHCRINGSLLSLSLSFSLPLFQFTMRRNLYVVRGEVTVSHVIAYICVFVGCCLAIDGSLIFLFLLSLPLQFSSPEIVYSQDSAQGTIRECNT